MFIAATESEVKQRLELQRKDKTGKEMEKAKVLVPETLGPTASPWGLARQTSDVYRDFW